MKGTTHIAAGIVAGLYMASHLDMTLPQAIGTTACCVLGSIFPDIDNNTSKLGRKAPITSSAIQLTFGHRTLFHAPLLYFVLGYHLFLAFPEQSFLITAFLTGIVTHIILDLANPAGISLFWPVSKRFRIARLRSGGIADKLLGGFLAVTALILFLMGR